MSMGYDKDAWRQHRVPTFIDTEDVVFGGLSWAQIVGLVIAALSGFGIFMVLGAAPAMVRFGTAGIIGLALGGLIGIRPGGRSLYTVLWEWLSFKLGPRYYADNVPRLVSRRVMAEEDRRRGKGGVQVLARVPLIGRSLWLNFFIRVPLKRKRSKVSVMGAVVAAVLITSSMIGCSQGTASAQVPVEYAGKRVFLQSIVTNLEDNINQGGYSATIRVKTGAPLEEAGVRVRENVLSVYEIKAHGSGLLPAEDKTTGRSIDPMFALTTAQEFGFTNVFLGPRDNIRPFCDISMGGDGFHTEIAADGSYNYKFRYHSTDCRIRQAKSGATLGLSTEDNVTKPFVSVRWIDRRQNQGALSIEKAMLPYPAPHVTKVEIKTVSTNGGELLNINDLCNIADTKVVSLGIQSQRPASPSPDYFDGQSGQRIAGEIQTCPLTPPTPIAAKAVLPNLAVFADGNPSYEISVRPYVETMSGPDVTRTAKMRVLDDRGGTLLEKNIPKAGEAGYDPLKPNTVKFNVAPSYFERKGSNSTELDSTILQFEVETEIVVKAIRPEYQPIEFWPVYYEYHITQCGCSRRSGTCSNGRCSCSCERNETRTPIKYWDSHFRVDSAARQYRPTDPSAVVTMTFSQKLTFEPMKFTFDRPYREFVYLTPTPAPGELRSKEYFSDGDSLGLWGGERLICDSGIAQDDEGRWTGWIWVEPNVNSKGQAYGGCRKAYACKLDIPEVEEVFGPGGTPTEEDYECIKR
ncbi:MAG: PrgI family protein [Chloroflexota bacterium]|nr:PrgI family protein [Chloroflexota bacterium]